MTKRHIIILYIFSLITLQLQAQLEFCTGNSGDPIFFEDFGTGVGEVMISSGSTTYGFELGVPFDGNYNVSNIITHPDWFETDDHTEGDTNGRMLIVNADFEPGEFYSIEINNLCDNTSYEFSAWVINLLPSNSSCPGGGLPIDVTFEIWDSLGNLLISGNTGRISGTVTPNWREYALVFQTQKESSVILKMRNNGSGGCGNDLAIDDIVFKSCGDTIIVEDTLNMTTVDKCEEELPFSTTLTATPDFAIFSSHFYQWQESNDGENWVDISGETRNVYTTPLINTTTFYRVKVAESVVNVNNQSCNTASDIYEIAVVTPPEPPISNGDVTICESDDTTLTVTAPGSVTVHWYDAPIGGNLLIANSRSYSPNVSGVYYAETATIIKSCPSEIRIPVELNILEGPQVTDETLSLCESIPTLLRANPSNPSVVTSYLWNTGSTSEQIRASTSGTYSVLVSSSLCSITKTITLVDAETPIIESVITNETDIIITTSNTGDFLYSIDGNTFQPSPEFSNIEAGQYTIHVKHRDCTEIVTMQHIHFFIPKFFTPNGDTINDTLNFKGLEFYSFINISIFDRYGKLLKNSRNPNFEWDGTFNSQPLPTGDYWCVVAIDGQKLINHFTLKR